MLHHFIKELVEDGRLKVAYVNTKDKCADPFTKSLEPAAFWQFVRMHGMTDSQKVKLFSYFLSPL